jgi:hypothetical protein
VNYFDVAVGRKPLVPDNNIPQLVDNNVPQVID